MHVALADNRRADDYQQEADDDGRDGATPESLGVAGLGDRFYDHTGFGDGDQAADLVPNALPKAISFGICPGHATVGDPVELGTKLSGVDDGESVTFRVYSMRDHELVFETTVEAADDSACYAWQAPEVAGDDYMQEFDLQVEVGGRIYDTAGVPELTVYLPYEVAGKEFDG